ncbi:MAG: pseudouridine synthase [Eubacteriales bacterium]|nr:pseudouridine synthase [Eubacteriales bacterium]
MAEQMRLDKLMALCGVGSRSQCKDLIRFGAVRIDGETAASGTQKVDPASSEVTVNGEILRYEPYIYLMLHKPAGYISATYDKYRPTVMDLLAGEYGHRELFPVGRLDEDTTGLLLLTDDGGLSHFLLSPKRHVPKTYHALLAKPLKPGDAEAFAAGMDLGDFTAQSASLRPLQDGWAEIIIHEGKFHQVKRMAQAIGNEVLSLKRVTFGPLPLDESLAEGDWRPLTEEEVALLRGAVGQ